MKKFFCFCMLAILGICFKIYPQNMYSYKKEIKSIEELISKFDNTKNNDLYECTKAEVELLLTEGIKYKLNLFEILYAANSYLSKKSLRIIMKGEFLRELESKIAYGNERVYALIPIDIIQEVQVGMPKQEGQHILDIFLKNTYKKYIEIGTVLYETHIGFSKIENNTFSGCFGMTVKKLGLKKKIDKIVMYEKTKIAIYVKAFPIPKRWVFENVYLK